MNGKNERVSLGQPTQHSGVLSKRDAEREQVVLYVAKRQFFSLIIYRDSKTLQKHAIRFLICLQTLMFNCRPKHMQVGPP